MTPEERKEAVFRQIEKKITIALISFKKGVVSQNDAITGIMDLIRNHCVIREGA